MEGVRPTGAGPRWRWSGSTQVGDRAGLAVGLVLDAEEAGLEADRFKRPGMMQRSSASGTSAEMNQARPRVEEAGRHRVLDGARQTAAGTELQLAPAW